MSLQDIVMELPAKAAGMDVTQVVIALGGSLFTLAGALGGAWLARHFEKQREAERRSYEDRVRFHSDRLKAYVDFSAAIYA